MTGVFKTVEWRSSDTGQQKRQTVTETEVISSAIAQLVEQVTVNHWVPGSSPGRGANLSPGYSAVR